MPSARAQPASPTQADSIHSIESARHQFAALRAIFPLTCSRPFRPCDAYLLAQPPFVVPINCAHTANRVLLCTSCDATHPDVVAERGTDAKERDCVVDWLNGEQLQSDRATAFCWETDPFPFTEFPNVTPSERRYFHYYTISKKLGVSGKKNRAKLPTCVTKKIAEMYPDAEGTPTKVGYQQDAE